MLCPNCQKDFFSIDNNPRGTMAENYIQCNKCRKVMLENDVIKFNKDFFHKLTYCDKHNKPKTKNIWGYYGCKDCTEENESARQEEKRLRNWNKYSELHSDLYIVKVQEDSEKEISESFKRLDEYLGSLKNKYKKQKEK